MDSNLRIIAQPSDTPRLHYPDGYQRREAEVRARIVQKYAGEIAKASWWRKWLLQRKRENEIRRELRFLFPSLRPRVVWGHKV